MLPSEFDEALGALGELLRDRHQTFDVVVVGGGGLVLARLIDRATKDIDVVALRVEDVLKSAEPLPKELVEAVTEVSALLDLAPDWLNNGPASTLRFGLPEGFLGRCEQREYGGLTVLLASRYDQIHLKVYAAADGAPNDKHHMDLKRLDPTESELRAAAEWTRTHDPSEGFALMLKGLLATFGVEYENG
ncbi:MAG TPA: DUF6036 family nucleotidyltransferase [Kofleriaceae bacterium]|jgi:hypothetical protein